MRLLRLACRCLRLAVVLMLGVAITLFAIPFCSRERRKALKAAWSAVLLDALAVRLDMNIDGIPPGSLLVANHISWLDVFVINAALPAAFVAKAEVRDWPLIGWVAARHDTVFLRRGSRGHARIVNAEIAALLERGEFVAVFPEGTTTDGSHVRQFHAALLEPALAAGRPVIPLALSYREADGRRSLAPRYDGDVTLWQSLRAVMRRPGLTARLVAAPAVGVAGEPRRVAAASSRAAILAMVQA